MSHHEKVICKVCGEIIRTCRCNERKEIILGGPCIKCVYENKHSGFTDDDLARLKENISGVKDYTVQGCSITALVARLQASENFHCHDETCGMCVCYREAWMRSMGTKA